MRIAMRTLSMLAVVCCFFMTGCFGGADSGAKEIENDAPQATSEKQDAIEIPVGASASRVAQLLGPADEATVLEDGRQLWRYANKRVEYIYVSNPGNGHVLVIGGYSRGNTPLLLTIVLDSAKKVTDFNFVNMTF